MTRMMMLMMMILMMMMLTMRQPRQQDPGALVVHAACCRPQAIPRDLQAHELLGAPGGHGVRALQARHCGHPGRLRQQDQEHHRRRGCLEDPWDRAVQQGRTGRRGQERLERRANQLRQAALCDHAGRACLRLRELPEYHGCRPVQADHRDREFPSCRPCQ